MQRSVRHAFAASLLLTFAAPPIAALPVDWSEAFQLEASNGIVNPAVLVGFNPQPDPPGNFGAGVMGLEFAYTSLSDAMVTLRIFDATGTPLSFAIAAVPEPAALSLFCLALFGLSARSATRRRT